MTPSATFYARRGVGALIVSALLFAWPAEGQEVVFNDGDAMDLTPDTYAGVVPGNKERCDNKNAALLVRFQGTNGTSITLQSRSRSTVSGIVHQFIDTTCVVTDALPQTCTAVAGANVDYQLVLSGGSPSVTALGLCIGGVVVEHRFIGGDVEIGGRLLLASVNDPSRPTLAFGDGDTGIFQPSDNNLALVTGGSVRFTLLPGGQLEGANVRSAFISNNASSLSIAVFSFRNDNNTGLHSSGPDTVSLISGGVEAVKVDPSQNVTIGGSTTSTISGVIAGVEAFRLDASRAVVMAEITPPGAPAANTGTYYFDDSGGKTRFVVRFPTGAVQVLASEP